MGSEFEKQDSDIISIFLELLGFDALIGFKSSMEEECHYIVEGSLWYGRRIGSKMMGFKEKIVLMTATMFGCKGVLNLYWKPVVLMLSRLVVWMGFCTSFCCGCGLCYFNHHWQGHGPMCTKVASEHEDGQECSLTKCQFSHDQVSNKCLRESQRFKPRLRHSLPHERMEKHTLLLLGSTQREEDSKREITVIVACTVEEDGEVIMDLEQMDEQQTLDILLHAISADQCTQDEEEIVRSTKQNLKGCLQEIGDD